MKMLLTYEKLMKNEFTTVTDIQVWKEVTIDDYAEDGGKNFLSRSLGSFIEFL